MTSDDQQATAAADAEANPAVPSDATAQEPAETADAAKPTTDNSRIIAEAGALADEICGCQDAPCTQKVQEKFMAWAKANNHVQASDEELEQITAISKRFMECAIKIQHEQGKK